MASATERFHCISKTNLDKNEKKLFLYFDTSHTNQTNKHVFHTLLTSMKI